MFVQHLQRNRFKNGGSTKYYVDSENSDDIQVVDVLQEKNDVSVLLGILSDNSITHRNIVVKIDRKDKTNQKEYNIGEQLYQEKIPGFIRYINDNKKTGKLCNAEQIDVLLMPFLPEGSIRNHQWNKSNVMLLKGLMMQVVLSSLLAYTQTGFIHNDLHLDNILIQKTKKREIVYTVSGETYAIPAFGYKIVIMDFGNSMIPVENAFQRYYWYDLLNVFTRINIDITAHDSTKMIWNCEKIILFCNRARDNNTNPIRATKLLHNIFNSTFTFDTLIPPVATYNPNVFR